MPVPAALSRLARLGVSAVGATTIDTWIGFTAFDPGCMTEQLDTGRDLNTGTRSHFADRSRDNQIRVAPNGRFKPTVAEWGALLEWIMGGTPTGSGTVTYPLAEREVIRSMQYDDTQTVWDLAGVAVDRATFSAQAGGELELSLDCCGTTYSDGGSFAAIESAGGPPLIMSDLSVTIGATSNVKVQSFQLEIAHNLDKERYFNSQTNAGPVAIDRAVTLSLGIPYGLHAALRAAGAAAGGVAVTCVFTFGGNSLTFSMPAVRVPDKAPAASVPQELIMPWAGQAMADADPGDELVAVLVTA